MDRDHLDSVCTDWPSVPRRAKLVMLHGGNYEANQIVRAVGHPHRFVTSVSGIISRRRPAYLESWRWLRRQDHKAIVERLQACRASTPSTLGNRRPAVRGEAQGLHQDRGGWRRMICGRLHRPVTKVNTICSTSSRQREPAGPDEAAAISTGNEATTSMATAPRRWWRAWAPSSYHPGQRARLLRSFPTRAR